MTDSAQTPNPEQPIWIRDVLLILAVMALFLFALQPREHAHGPRRREADAAADVQSAPVSPRWHRYEAEALDEAVMRPAFRASR